ncbi:hypothetical protein IEQ34_001979 [Dendrobium chrysotoxum]|uniref:Uncharacterized protein n=1 Tax=Dendrobium chrysotoxum TaxID=161865 RepID=A0AAV7HIQ4_DENCH|nr:hypothetical protein IEQ34_001979 [Dendrobium chrysotoxum]
MHWTITPTKGLPLFWHRRKILRQRTQRSGTRWGISVKVKRKGNGKRAHFSEMAGIKGHCHPLPATSARWPPPQATTSATAGRPTTANHYHRLPTSACHRQPPPPPPLATTSGYHLLPTLYSSSSPNQPPSPPEIGHQRHPFRQPEVAEPTVQVRVEEHIARFYVAMDDDVFPLM